MCFFSAPSNSSQQIGIPDGLKAIEAGQIVCAV